MKGLKRALTGILFGLLAPYVLFAFLIIPANGSTIFLFDTSSFTLHVLAVDPQVEVEIHANNSCTETTTWRKALPANVPPARDYTALAYDSIRGVTVLFGGQAEPYNYLNDTWEWDGVDWSHRWPASSPSARSNHAMAYDGSRGFTVLFAGFDGGWPADTWEWNGNNWQKRTPALSPPGLTGHALAYDKGRNLVVFFGGFGANFMDETWEWDGDNWVQRFPVNSPAPRAHHAMAYDEVHGRVVLFGGYDFNNSFNDTWEWDGTNWTQRFPASMPARRNTLAMVYDTSRQLVVLFGGKSNTGWMSDTWVWDGNNWFQEFPLISPPERQRHGLAYDIERLRTVLFGGSANNIPLGDTWEYEYLDLQVEPSSWITTSGSVVTCSIFVEGTPVSTEFNVLDLSPEIQWHFETGTGVMPPSQLTLTLTTTHATLFGVYPFTLVGATDILTTTIPLTLTLLPENGIFFPVVMK